MPEELKIVEAQLDELRKSFASREVANFENSKQHNTKTSSNLTCFQDGVFGPYTEPGTTLNAFYEETMTRVGRRIEAVKEIQTDGQPLVDSDFSEQI